MKFLQQNSLTQTSMSWPKEDNSPPLRHPYLTGNFAPIHQTKNLTPCTYSGCIPPELTGGQYVRNGGNPVSHQDLGKDAHWFDGDGMLSGVAFRKTTSDGKVIPEFVNQYILTDLYLSRKTTSVRSPIMPSITTLVNPLSTMFQIMFVTFRAIFLVILSNLPGSQQAIKRISVANTALLYHDGRALATCESGPPMRIHLPSLDTVGWFDGVRAEGEPETTLADNEAAPFGGSGVFSFMKEWTTGHPKVDPFSGEMLLYHNTFLPPYVHYSVLPKSNAKISGCRLVNQPVLGVSGARMMHDFGASRSHTIIMDLPLSLDPLNTMKGKEVVAYDSTKPSRFGVFPRHDPSSVRWFHTAPCCIFHTANTWDCQSSNESTVNLLACRMTSSTLVYTAGNIRPPAKQRVARPRALTGKGGNTCRFKEAPSLESPGENDHLADYFSGAEEYDDYDQCRLYYYEFDLSTKISNIVRHQWALSSIPFEFPSVRLDREMQDARYIYGCSTSTSCFGVALGRADKVDLLVKMDAKTLIERGKKMNTTPITGCVDRRSVNEILNPIQIFRLPPSHYAQEPRFVPRSSSTEEDDGFLLFYVFDESQILPSGDCSPSSISELWILDAKNMRDVVAKVKLPQRVPYGLHGTWFSSQDIEEQRGIESLRSLEKVQRKKNEWVNSGGQVRKSWMVMREKLERAVG
ncbi:lignostilbene alphabeta-dioxygenase I [Fusarium beomiforme]|uniref:Lignostilbene alphabeta-dioxygenase I n=1 Tax=Fusarium beomiforme TaxID=44412 RepID=A0A9P5AJP0_9HYPO|nr:lignostilbene alphabeta-dioxygenase I [Fusarium beomiforme]